MRKYIALAALILTIGCTKENFAPTEPTDPNIIRIETSLGTRASMTNFETGDCLSLYAVEYNGDQVSKVQSFGNYINNEPMTFDGEQWLAVKPLYWSASKCDFYGFYPYQPTGPMSGVRFEIATDQSTTSSVNGLGGYEASDLMWAKAEGVEPPQVITLDNGEQQVTYAPVHLQFQHLMSRIVVNILRGKDFEGELSKNISVHIYDTATSAIVDWTIGSLKVDPQGGRKTITMRQLDSDTFDAIVVPQFIQRSTPLIEVSMDGIAYLFDTSISLRPGKMHTINVTLNTSPDQEKVEIELEGGVGGWN